MQIEELKKLAAHAVTLADNGKFLLFIIKNKMNFYPHYFVSFLNVLKIKPCTQSYVSRMLAR